MEPGAQSDGGGGEANMTQVLEQCGLDTLDPDSILSSLVHSSDPMVQPVPQQPCESPSSTSAAFWSLSSAAASVASSSSSAAVAFPKPIPQQFTNRTPMAHSMAANFSTSQLAPEQFMQPRPVVGHRKSMPDFHNSALTDHTTILPSGRRRTVAMIPSAPPPPPPLPQSEEEERRRNFLERNRQAALKCRQRKKQWLADLQHRVEYLNVDNEKLEQQVNMLRDEILNLKTLLLAHKDCPVAKANGIVEPHILSKSSVNYP